MLLELKISNLQDVLDIYIYTHLNACKEIVLDNYNDCNPSGINLSDTFSLSYSDVVLMKFGSSLESRIGYIGHNLSFRETLET